MSTMIPAMDIEEDLPLVEIIEELDGHDNIITSRAVVLGSADVQASNIQNDDGTPIIEIFEELDQYDNIISSHTFQMGITHPQLEYEEHMQTAGMKLWTVFMAHTSLSLAEEPKFTLFAQFPPELRNKIWKLALGGPRVVKIYEWMDTHDGGRTVLANTAKPKAAYKIPALLHTNQEARSLAKQKYRPILADALGGIPVYFDFKEDTLFMGDPYTFRYMYKSGAPFANLHYIDPESPTNSDTTLVEQELRFLAMGDIVEPYKWRFFLNKFQNLVEVKLARTRRCAARWFNRSLESLESFLDQQRDEDVQAGIEAEEVPEILGFTPKQLKKALAQIENPKVKKGKKTVSV